MNQALLIDLTGRQTPWPTVAVDLWRTCLGRASGEDEYWTHTPPRQGDPLLRTVLGKRLSLDPEHLVITAGVRSTAIPLGRASADAVVEQPTFVAIPRILRGMGARVIYADWEQIASIPRDGKRPRAIWITSPARNPDGASISAALAVTLAQCAHAGDLVVQNEVYRWYAPRAARIKGAFLVGSMSKIAGSGTRLGWVWHPAFSQIAETEMIALSPPGPWQRAWAYFIEQGGLDLLMHPVIRSAVLAKEAFLTAISDCGRRFTVPVSEGPSLILHLERTRSEETLAGRLREAGLLVGLGRHFHVPTPAIRLCFTGISTDEAVLAAARLYETSPELVINPVAC